MKILVFPDELDISGGARNTIELCAALRDLHGYEVVLFATPGPMVNVVQEKGLRFLPAPPARFHPSPARVRAFEDAVRRERPDLIYVWEWWECVEAYYNVYLRMRIPMVVTSMAMSVSRLLPKQVPTTFGTQELVDQARSSGWRKVELLVPPVDVVSNAPGVADPQPLRERYGIQSGDVTLVTVSRLDACMKAESLLRTFEVVRRLGRDLPLRLLVVGDGTARTNLACLASAINNELNRPAVVLTGALLDPRPAYAAADIIIGMGGSALRGMAFGKPAIVVGERGFCDLLTEDTARAFLYKGIFGYGDGTPSNAHMIAQIRHLAMRPKERAFLGQFSRDFVVNHFSLESVCTRLAEFCHSAAHAKVKTAAAITDGLRSAAIYLKERRFFSTSRAKMSRDAFEMAATLK